MPHGRHSTRFSDPVFDIDCIEYPNGQSVRVYLPETGLSDQFPMIGWESGHEKAGGFRNAQE